MKEKRDIFVIREPNTVRGRNNCDTPLGKTFKLTLLIFYDNKFKARFGPKESDIVAKYILNFISF